jgi:hypothetical protein
MEKSVSKTADIHSRLWILAAVVENMNTTSKVRWQIYFAVFESPKNVIAADPAASYLRRIYHLASDDALTMFVLSRRQGA